MAKRFLDTGFLEQKWIRKLSPERKIFLIYLMLKCDNGGIIELDMEDVEFWIGKKIGDPLKFLPEGYLILIHDSGKYFMPKFIEWQYPNFPHSKVHQQAQAKDILIRNGIFDIDTQSINICKVYVKVMEDLPNIQANGNANVNGNVNGNVNANVNENEISHPSVDEIKDWMYHCGCRNMGESEKFWLYYESKGWMIGQVPMVNWKAAVLSWIRRIKDTDDDGFQFDFEADEPSEPNKLIE